MSYSRNTSQTSDPSSPFEKSLPTWAHPNVKYWYDEWKLIRDCLAGEREIKQEQQLYLTRLEGQEPGEYGAYLERATFYNFTSRTLNALVGTIYARSPVVTGVPDRLVPRLASITKDGENSDNFFQNITTEILSLGRAGVLVDLSSSLSADPRPYLIDYKAENILDWDTTVIDDVTHPDHGKRVLSLVILREIDTVRNTKTGVKKFVARYRALSLELLPNPKTGLNQYTYVQRYYTKPNDDASFPTNEAKETIPTRRGEPLNFIPFRLFGAIKSTAIVEKPPIIDIARLNVSHYRSYAHLEHGRFFTGLPIYYVELSSVSEGDSDYTLGPSVVWETQIGSKPGILEFNGHGLKFLSDALAQKEAQAASLGGRMIGVLTASTSESDNALQLKDRNEKVILLNTVKTADTGFAIVMNWWAWWQGEDGTKIQVEHNRDFLLSAAGARELRAVQGMYKDGLLPIDVFYDYMHKAEVIPDWMELEEFEALLSNVDSFPGLPDAQARGRGYTTRQQEISAEDKDWELEIEEQLAGIEDATLKEAKRAALVTERTASKAAAKPQPVVNPNPGQVKKVVTIPPK